MDNVICRHRYHTEDFTKSFDDAGNLTLVAEASTLGRLAGMDCYSQVWNDACDEGIILVSQNTGNKLIFTLKGADTDGEGEVAGWRFAAHVRAHNAPDKLRNLQVLIIND